MAEDEGGERTLDPSPQKIERARREGDIPVSQDLTTFASYLGLFLALLTAGGAIALGLAEPLSAFLAAPHGLADQILAPGGGDILEDLIGSALLATAPLFALPALAAVLSLLAQRAVVVAPNRIAPKLSRLNPISNAAQKFGPSGLVEFVKQVAKLVLIAAALGAILYVNHDGVEGLMAMDARALPELLYEEAILILIAALVVAGLIAAFDVLWQQHSHFNKLKMTQQEAKDEAKDAEGDPHLKQERRIRGQRIAMGRMLQDVPDADVVIVNPTHYAVALKWERRRGSAPVCVAKGVDEIAARIREIADETGVPIHSDPPTARALHATVEVGAEIHPDHYQAVAIAIRFADAARAAARARGPGWRS